MDPVLQQKCEKLIQSRDVVKKAASFNFSQMHLLSGMMYMMADETATKERIKECNKILKGKVNIVSNMRSGIVGLAVVTKMSTQPDPEEYIDRLLQAYNVLTAGKIYCSEYLVLTAMAMVDNVEPDQYERVASATWQMYGRMHAEHPMLTDQNDTTFAALMVIYGQDAAAIMDEMELCYKELSKKGFFLNKNTAQAAAQILSLSDKPVAEKCARYRALRAALKEQKCALGGGPEQAILAAFADVDVPDEQLVAEIVEVEAWLKKQKGMGMLGVGSQLRRVMACVIVLDAHKGDKATGAAVAGTSIASSITTQIVITIVMITLIISVSATVNATH